MTAGSIWAMGAWQDQLRDDLGISDTSTTMLAATAWNQGVCIMWMLSVDLHPSMPEVQNVCTMFHLTRQAVKAPRTPLAIDSTWTLSVYIDLCRVTQRNAIVIISACSTHLEGPGARLPFTRYVCGKQ